MQENHRSLTIQANNVINNLIGKSKIGFYTWKGINQHIENDISLEGFLVSTDPRRSMGTDVSSLESTTLSSGGSESSASSLMDISSNDVNS